MGRRFAIGDIHGCSRTFKKLLFEELRIERTDSLWCVGDYIDRGPDSKGVIDLILDLRNDGFNITTLRGNHEQMMMDSLKDEVHLWLWMANGGDETLRSFGISSYREMKPLYMDFFNHTHYYVKEGDFIVAHAGLNFSIEDPFKDTYSMLWIRSFEQDHEKLNGKTLIHGHTPISLYYIEKQKDEKIINIDGGCVYKPHGKYGHLVAYDMDTREFRAVEYADQMNE